MDMHLKKIVGLVALKVVLLAAAVVVVMMNMVGCNTVQGLGKDVSKLGDKIEHKAEEKKNY